MKNIIWNCLGDSITAPIYIDKHYYDYIAARMPGLTIYNYGVAGTKLSGGREDSFVKRCETMNPEADIVTVFGGVNDWGAMSGMGPVPIGTITDDTENTFYGGLNLLVEGIKKTCPHAKIVFITPIGNDGYVGTHGFAVGKNCLGLEVKDYVDAMVTVANGEGFGIANLYRYCGFTPTDSYHNQKYFLDGLHLTCEGHERISYLIEGVMRQILWEPRQTKDIILFAGQSNMAGRGLVDSAHPQLAPCIDDNAGYEYRVISHPGCLVPMEEPFGVHENNPQGIKEKNPKTGSLVTAFSNAYHAITGNTVIGVSASEGGTTISQWLPGRKRLGDAMGRLDSAKGFLGKEYDHIYMAWCQGESDGDRGVSVSSYKKNFMSMWKECKSHGVELCFLIEIGEYNGNKGFSYGNIRQAQEELAEECDDVILVSQGFLEMKTRGLMKDSYHFFQQAYNEVGTEAGTMAGYYTGLSGFETRE